MEEQKKIDTEKFLQSSTYNAGDIAKYDRIMSHNLSVSIDSFTKGFNIQTQKLINSIDNFNETNKKVSNRLYLLNVLLVILTLILVFFGFIQTTNI